MYNKEDVADSVDNETIKQLLYTYTHCDVDIFPKKKKKFKKHLNFVNNHLKKIPRATVENHKYIFHLNIEFICIFI